MSADQDLSRIADEIVTALPQDGEKAAHIALSVAAAKCIDAGISDDEAGRGLLSAIRHLRDRLRRGRPN
jgi:hypothetical protein